MRTAAGPGPKISRAKGARIVAPSGFEPLSPAPKASMLGHYTTGLAVPTGER